VSDLPEAKQTYYTVSLTREQIALLKELLSKIQVPLTAARDAIAIEDALHVAQDAAKRG
jgi:hypothetical protein